MGVIIVAVILGMGIMLVFIGLATSGRGSGISARLERYTAGKPDPVAPSTQPNAGLSDVLASSVAIARLNKIVEQRDFGANLARSVIMPSRRSPGKPARRAET